MRKYLRLLVENGWVDERPHPQEGWNKTTQYRVNLRKLGSDLEAIGRRPPEVYRDVFIASLGEQDNGRAKEGKEALEERNSPSNQNKEFGDCSSRESSFLSNDGNLASKEKHFSSNKRNFPSKEKNLASYTYTEITSENKSKEHKTRVREDETFLVQSLKIWNSHLEQDVHFSEDRKTKLKALLEQHFDNDFVQWEQFCQRIKSSPFLMGEGSRKWRVTFDWILEEGNFLKILEGNFDDGNALQLKKAEVIQAHQDKEKNEVLSSIEDSWWRYWCRQVSFGDEPLSLRELKKVAPASFGEFDGRLVWIESDSLKVLNAIEDLRLKFFSVIGKTYPQARNIRTRLKNTPQAVADVSLPHPAIISQFNPLKQERKIYAQ